MRGEGIRADQSQRQTQSSNFRQWSDLAKELTTNQTAKPITPARKLKIIGRADPLVNTDVSAKKLKAAKPYIKKLMEYTMLKAQKLFRQWNRLLRSHAGLNL